MSNKKDKTQIAELPNAEPWLSERYELTRTIVCGTMSNVFEAYDRHLNRKVAIKVLAQDLAKDPEFIRRFRNEAKAAARLQHPNIVEVYDLGNQGNTHYIVMEYLEGDSLAGLLRRRRRLNPLAVTGMAFKVALALSFAHSHGVIHRDIKPANILYTSEGEVKVADFGIAYIPGAEASPTTITSQGHKSYGQQPVGSTTPKATQSQNLNPGADIVLGTVTYFSPEQAKGERVSARSDLYSLGVVLYETLMGKPPFSGDFPAKVAYKHTTEQPPPLSEEVPRATREIVMKLLAKNPKDRFVSAEELAYSLKESI